MKQLIKNVKRLALALCLATPIVSWADYPTSDIISLNISNDGDYRMTGDGETETLAGLLPDNAWKNTKQTDRTGVMHSGDVRNGYSNGVTAWDGVNQQVVTLDGVVFTWAVEGDGTANYGWVDAANNPVFHKAWLARKSAAEETSTILLQNLPYEKYDVIVYCFGADDTAFNPVAVNGTYYVGDTTLETETNTRLATSSSETWGGRRAQPSLGQTAIRVNGLSSPELLLSIRSGVTSICAVQIVRDMSAIGDEVLAEGKVISVNLQSSYNTNGYKSESYGLVRVPATAWTEDGLSSASDGGTDVTVVKEWNGSTKTSYALSGITINEKAKNPWRAYKYNNNNYGEYIPIANLINSYLDDGENRARITVEGVPYKQYDVIVYTSTDSKGNYFGPVTVNNTSYCWNNGNTVEADSADSTETTRWGYSLCPIPAYGVNALRITGQTSSTLTITGANNANNARGGIAGFQIVDTYVPPAYEVEPNGTIEISEQPTEEVSVVCEGSLTVVGTDTYTVTESDLRLYDFSGVEGTVTLGSYTQITLGDDRQLPEAYKFGEGSEVVISETREEFIADLFMVSGLEGVSYVKLTRADGTVVDHLEVTDGGATFGSGAGTTKIDGAATLYDLTFANNAVDEGHSGYHSYQGYFTYTCGTGQLNYANDAAFNNDDWDETTGLYLRCSPYIDSAQSVFNALGDFTTVVVGQMSPTHNTIFLHLGSCNSNEGNGLLIATTEKDNEVIIAKNTGTSVDAVNGVKASVPNAATARHAYVIIKRGSVFTVWVDGTKRGSIDVGDNFQLGTSGHSGLQVGSHFGGNGLGETWKSVANNESETGVVNVIRVFDYAISDVQAEAIVNAYPYESEGGLYKRTVDGNAEFSAEGAWKDTDDTTYEVPVSAAEGYNPSATITVDSDSTLTVNVDDVTLEKLTVGGSGTLTFDGDCSVTVADAAIINSPVVVNYGALDISGVPVHLGSAGSITFDCSQFDVSSIYVTTRYQLTGNIEQDDNKVAIIEPTASALGRTVTSGYNFTGSCYELVITVDHEAGSDVYYKSGYFGKGGQDKFKVVLSDGTTETAVFPDDAVVIDDKSAQSEIYVGELPDNVEAIKVNRDVILASGDASNEMLDGATVTVGDECTLTIQRNWNDIVLGDVEFNGSGVVLDSNDGTITVSGSITGTSTLTIAAGKAVTAESTSSVANAIVLEAGATLTVKDGAGVCEPGTAVAHAYVKETSGDGETVYSVVEAYTVTILTSGGNEQCRAWLAAGDSVVDNGNGSYTVYSGANVELHADAPDDYDISATETVAGGEPQAIEPDEEEEYISRTITADTTYTITFTYNSPVAMVYDESGNHYFDTLESAIRYANPGTTVTLCQDCPDKLVLEKAITIDTNGHVAFGAGIDIRVDGGCVISDEMSDSFLGDTTWIVASSSGEAPNCRVEYGYGERRTVKMDYPNTAVIVEVETGDLVRRVPDDEANQLGGPSGVYFYVKDGAVVPFKVALLGDSYELGSVTIGESTLDKPTPVAEDFGIYGFLNTYSYTSTEITGDAVTVIKVNAGRPVAKNGDAKYVSLQDAIAAAESDDTITLLDDITVDKIVGIKKNLELDLNGKIITGTDIITLVVDNCFLTVVDNGETRGKITNINGTERVCPTILVQSGGLIVKGANIAFEGDNEYAAIASVAVTGGSIMVCDGSVLTSNAYGLRLSRSDKGASGTITIDNSRVETDYCALYDVSDGNEFDAITIRNGAIVTSAEDFAVYKVGPGELNISGDTTVVSGSTGIDIRSGTVTISGGTITATESEAYEYKFEEDKESNTGDAVLVENCNYPGGAPVVSITGGTFRRNAMDAKAVASYAANGAKEAVAGFIYGGTFDTPVPEELSADGYIPCEVAGGYSVKQGSYAAEIVETGAKFETLAAAVYAAEDDNTITLLDNITVDEYVSITKDMELDLNGKTITGTDFITLVVHNCFVTVVDNGETRGKITNINETDESYPTILVQRTGGLVIEGANIAFEGKNENAAIAAVAASGGSITVRDDSVLTSNAYGLRLSRSDNEASGTITIDKSTLSTVRCAIYDRISGNENDAITIRNGAIVTSAEDSAVYKVGPGELNISGDTTVVSGSTGIDIGSGTVTISGGTITATKSVAAAYEFVEDEGSDTGDAVLIENCNYPGGAPVVSITGGTFRRTATDAKAVASYAANGAKEAVTGFIYGGTFDTPVPEELCADGYIPCEVTGGYSVKPNVYVAQITDDAKYYTIAEAFAAAKDDDAITVIANNTLTGEINVGVSLTLDLNGYTVTGAAGDNVMFNPGTNVTFTIKDSSEGATGKLVSAKGKVVCSGNDCTLRIESGTVEATRDVPIWIWRTSKCEVIVDGGTIIAGRGITEEEDGNYGIVATYGKITFNGGVLHAPNCDGFRAFGGVEINGGSVTVRPNGEVVRNNYNAVVNDGRFNIDVKNICADGKTTKKEGEWYVIVDKPAGIDPTAEEQVVLDVEPTATQEEAQAAAEGMDVQVTTAVQEVLTEAEVSTDDYQGYFTKTAVQNAVSGVWEVQTTVAETVTEDVNEDAAEKLLAAVADAQAETVSVEVPAGLYYKVETFDMLGGEAVDTKTGLSAGATTGVAKPTGTTRGFIRVTVGAAPLK